MTIVDIDAHTAFRDELVGAGLLLPLGADGLYGRSSTFEDIVDGLDRHVLQLSASVGATRVRFPPLMPTGVFEATDYLRSFPDLTGAVLSFRGDDRAHARLLAAADAGEDWTSMLQPAGVTLCPAVCHPLYPTLRGAMPEGGARFDVQGWVFRHEPSVDPARMQAFRQHHRVYVGDPAGAR